MKYKCPESFICNNEDCYHKNLHEYKHSCNRAVCGTMKIHIECINVEEEQKKILKEIEKNKFIEEGEFNV